jgi:maintenance of morphology protein 1
MAYPSLQEMEFDATYTDSLSLSLSTSYLFNYPMSSFARLPVSLTISLSNFQSSVISPAPSLVIKPTYRSFAQILITPPLSTAATPTLTISIPPVFTLDLTTTSLMGSRAKLANVPKLHELIQHQVRRILAARGTWKVVLPGLSSISEARDEIRRELKEELFS